MQSELTSPATLSSIFTFESSENTDKLDEAWAKAQGEIDVAVAGALNPHFKSQYADLASCWRACRAPLSKYGIALTQWPVPASSPGRVALMTRIAHGGQWMRSTLECPVTKQDPQGVGSALTYLRRYMLSAVAGIAPEDDDLKDDDGNRASGLVPTSKRAMAAALGTLKPASQQPRKGGISLPMPKNPVVPSSGGLNPGPGGASAALTEPQLARLFAIASDKGWSKEGVKHYMTRQFGVASSRDLSREQYDNLIRAIESDPKPDDPGSDPAFDTWNGPGGP